MANDNVISVVPFSQGTASTATKQPRNKSRAEQISDALFDTIKGYFDQSGYLPFEFVSDPDQAGALSAEVESNIEMTIEQENVFRSKGNKWKPQYALTASQIGDILLATGVFVCYKDNAGSRLLLLAITDGDDAGTYLPQYPGTGTQVDPSSETARLCRNLYPACETAIVNQAIQYIRTSAKLVDISKDTGLIFTQSGVVDIRPPRTSPDYMRYDDPDYETTYGYKSEKPVVRTWKVRTEYNPNATLPVISTPDGMWTPVDMIKSWYDIDRYTDSEKDLLVKAILTMINGGIRGTSFKRLVMLADSANGSGGGGKSTCIDLIACVLAGDTKSPMIMTSSLDDLDKQFALADIARTGAILSHECDCPKGIESLNNVKKLATGEPVSVEAKFKGCYSMDWNGLMIQAFNDFPTFRGRGAGALLSGRALGLRHERDFRSIYPKERKYIKDDLIKRPEVREYLLNEAIKLGYIDDYDPAVLALLKRNMSDVRDQGSKTWMYLADVMPLVHEWREMLTKCRDSSGFDMSKFVFRLPVALLYDCYKIWCKKYDNDKPSGIKAFTADLAGWVAEHKEWRMIDKDKPKRTPTNMYWTLSDANGSAVVNPLLWEYCPEDDFSDLNYAHTNSVHKYHYTPRCVTYRGNIEYVG